MAPPSPDPAFNSSAHGQPSAPRGTWAPTLLLACLAAFCGLTLLIDSDTFTHLGCGRWMLEHRQLLATNHFGLPETANPSGEWVNVHWGFQLLVASLERLGGYEALSILNAALAAALFALFAAAFRGRAPAAIVMAVGLLVWLNFMPRLRVRPELLTFLFFLLTLTVLEGARRDRRTSRLWILAPLNLVWVNVHGLYFLGPSLTIMALVGDLLDARLRPRPRTFPASGLLAREARLPLLAALLACFVNPWPIQMALHPLLLSTRLVRPELVAGVGEFQRTWMFITHLRHLPLLATLVLASVAALITWRRTPVAHLLWLLSFTILGLSAVRNVPLAAMVAGFVLLARQEELALGFPRLASGARRLASPAALCAALAIAAAGASFSIGLLQKTFGIPLIPGVGLKEDRVVGLKVGRFLAQLHAPGDILPLEWSTGSVLIMPLADASAAPHRLWFDGRLEAYSFQRFLDQAALADNVAKQSNPANAFTAYYPSGSAADIRFVVGDPSHQAQLYAMARSPAFRLIYVDLNNACFARIEPSAADGNGPAETLPAQPDWSSVDRPLDRDGFIAGSGWRRPTGWIATQECPDTVFGRMAIVLAASPRNSSGGSVASANSLHLSALSIRHLTAGLNRGVIDPDICRISLAEAHALRAGQIRSLPSPAFPIDVHAARAIALCRSITPAIIPPLVTPDRVQVLLVDALLRSGQVDSAASQVSEMLRTRNPRMGPLPPALVALARESEARANVAGDAASRRISDKDSPLQAARVLAGADLGLTAAAADALEGQPPGPTMLLLGDLQLRSGLVDKARAAYARADLPADAPELRLRDALCLWVEGELFVARDRLAQIVHDGNDPIARRYLDDLNEVVGAPDHSTP
ncbi:MAG: hypothetical protein NTW19_14835 [Planctomycetota bacterium]|nr:hypothetical protein [Planctomycetota bacterium]